MTPAPVSPVYAGGAVDQLSARYFQVPFGSTLLANGQVLVDADTIFDPPTDTITFSTPTVTTAEGAASQYKFVLLCLLIKFLKSGAVFLGCLPPYSIPPRPKFAPAGNLAIPAIQPDCGKLLPNGEVLIAGGAFGPNVRQVEFYVGPVRLSAACQ